MSKVIQVNTMKEALLAMSVIIEEGDTLLIENDIPEGLVQQKEGKMIALFYGGCSLEHEISILSALQFVKYFEKNEVILVYVSKENKFYIGECLHDFDFYTKTKLSQCKEVILEKKEILIY